MKTLLIILISFAGLNLRSQNKIQSKGLASGQNFREKVNVVSHPDKGMMVVMLKEGSSRVSVSLWDGSGKEVYSDEGIEGLLEFSIITSGFKKGIYKLKITENKREISKMIRIV